jgi:hypothetical protein
MLTNGRPEDAPLRTDELRRGQKKTGPTHDLIPPPHTDAPPHHSFLFHPPPSVTSPLAGAAATATAREAPARATPARGR